MPGALDRITGLIRRTGGVDEFVATERVGERAELIRARSLPTIRRTTTETLDVVLFRDLPRGRGSARLHLATPSVNPGHLIADTAARAARMLGPPWRLPPPSAPARVELADPDLDPDLTAAVHGLQRTITDSVSPSPDRASDLAATITGLAIAVERIRTTVRNSRGFSHAYDETRITADLTLAVGRAVERVRVHGRRAADLRIAGALARAVDRGRQRATARPLPADRYDLLLTDGALMPTTPRLTPWSTPWSSPPAAPRSAPPTRKGREPGVSAVDYGWFAPIVAQASSRAARHGLSRYRIGQPIHGTRNPTGDPWTVISDGTVPFGLLSQPIGDLGEPVRRFALIDRGHAAAHALDLREAALRGQTGNGGVRNLLVTPGTTPPASLRRPGPRPLVEALDLAWLDIDPRTGTFTAQLDLALVHRSGAPPTPSRGGRLSGNLFDWLARTRLSSRETTAAWYTGPDAIRIDDIPIT